MAKLQRTDNTQVVLNDYITRMESITDPIQGFEGKPEVFMRASLQVQVEQAKAQLSVELSKIKVMEAILKTLQAKEWQK